MRIEYRGTVLSVLVGARFDGARVHIVHLDLVCLVALRFLSGGFHDRRVAELLRLLRAEPTVAVVAGGDAMKRLASLRAVGAQTAADGDTFLVRQVDLVPCR